MNPDASDLTIVERGRRIPPLAQRGSLILLVMCLLAVLGITLASYLAVSNNAMKLSNRAFQTGVSQQLTEMGLVEALRAFNANDWTTWTNNGATATWSTSGTTANCTISFSSPTTKFGNTVSNASVKIRVDNYNAKQLNSTWSSSANYRTGDLVAYNGVWYRCLLAHSNQTPTSTSTGSSSTATYWIEEQMPLQIPWSCPTTYKLEAVVYYSGSWYRCILAHTSSPSILPTNTSYWTAISVITTDVATSMANNESLLHYWSGATWAWWRYNSGWDGAPAVSWRWRGSYAYVIDDVVAYNGIWYRCISPTSSSSSPPANPSCWSNAPSNTAWAWSSSSINYSLNDVVYYSNHWYRCILAHTSSGTITPSNSTYWANAPRFSTTWSSSKQYSQYDTVRYNGVWYLSLASSNIGQNPATATSYWVGANTSTTSYQWNATTAYSVGNYKCYGGVWYKCTTGNTGQSPNNTSYWTASWANSWGVTTGAPVIYTQSSVTLPDGTAPLTTELRATIFPAPLFPNAAAATSTISANSAGTVDSYDSTTGTSALQPGVAGATAGTQNGIYGTYASQVGTSTNYSAVLASSYTAGTAITLSSTTVKGYLAAPPNTSSPYAPLYSSGGTVKGFTSPATPNIDLSHISRSPYIPQFDTIPGGAGGLATNWASIPKGTALSLSATTNIGTPGDTTPSRYYYNGSLTIGGASIQYLKINGPVILYVNGDLFITNSSSIGRIDISSAGSAEIHVAGRFMADAGGEGIQNYTGDPKSLIIICDTTSTSTHFYSEGVNDLYGVIYVPYSTSTTGYYNDNTNTEIFGAVSANKITYSGANLNIHYDTSLRYATFGGVDQPYSISEWRELTDPTEQVTLP